jgi:hypothetical protein
LLMLDIKKQEQAECDRKRQSNNINNAECAVLYQVAPGDFYIISEHKKCMMSDLIMSDLFCPVMAYCNLTLFYLKSHPRRCNQSL